MKSWSAINAALAASPVRFSVLTPAPGASYVPIYLAPGAASGRFASVNAGNSNVFFVGGGGLNQAFGKALAQAGSYVTLQTNLYNAVTPPALVASQSFPAAQPVCFALVQRPTPAQSFFSDYEGTVFVDVFQPGATPAGNPANYAMIYVCPPNAANYTTPATFLTAVQATALNLISAVRVYNQQSVPANAGLGTLQIMRLFLFSSGIYLQPLQPQVSVDDVARAVCSGLLAGLAQGATGLAEIQLPNSSGEYASVKLPPPAKAAAK